MDLLTVQETAALLKVSDGTVRRHVAAGRLPAVRVGRLIRIRRAAIECFLAPVKPVSWEPTTDDDPIWSIIGMATTDEPTDIARYKDEYIADAILGRQLAPLMGTPTADDDPFWDIVGIGDAPDAGEGDRREEEGSDGTPDR